MSRSLAFIFSTLVVFGSLPGSAQSTADEYRLKAAVISKIPSYADWPVAAMTGRSSFDLCVVTPHRFGNAFDELAAGEQIKSLPIHVRDVRPSEPIDTCQVLVLPRDAGTRAALLRKSSALPILTVGDSSNVLAAGGIVELSLDQGRVRFAINLKQSEKVGLHFSAQLLRLAFEVRRDLP